jgi:hypothetical protein
MDQNGTAVRAFMLALVRPDPDLDQAREQEHSEDHDQDREHRTEKRAAVSGQRDAQNKDMERRRDSVAMPGIQVSCSMRGAGQAPPEE